MAGLAVGLLGSLLGPLIVKPIKKLITGKGKRRQRRVVGRRRLVGGRRKIIGVPEIVPIVGPAFQPGFGGPIGGRRRRLKQRRLRRL